MKGLHGKQKGNKLQRGKPSSNKHQIGRSGRSDDHLRLESDMLCTTVYHLQVFKGNWRQEMEELRLRQEKQMQAAIRENEENELKVLMENEERVEKVKKEYQEKITKEVEAREAKLK